MKRFLLVGVLLVGSAVPASAGWFGKGYLPECDSKRVLNSVMKKFRYANNNTFHWGVEIDSISEPYEMPERILNNSSIDRRYCQASAWMSDGSRSDVVYLIETRQGFSGISYRVESCLPDFDPWHVYGAWCHAIEP